MPCTFMFKYFISVFVCGYLGVYNANLPPDKTRTVKFSEHMCYSWRHIYYHNKFIKSSYITILMSNSIKLKAYTYLWDWKLKLYIYINRNRVKFFINNSLLALTCFYSHVHKFNFFVMSVYRYESVKYIRIYEFTDKKILILVKYNC